MLYKSVTLMLACMSLLLSHNGIAGSLYKDKSSNNNFEVFVPNLESSTEFSVGGFHLRPGGSNDYAVLVTPLNPDVATPILSPFWEPKGFHPDFETG